MQLIASAVVFAVVVAPSLAQSFTFQVNTPPSCPECGPCLLTWSEDPQSTPYLVSILPAGQTGAPPILPPVTTNLTMITFNAPFQANTQFTLGVTDSLGHQQFSSPIPVVTGPSTSCVNSNSSAFTGSGVSSSGGGSSGGSTGSSSPSGSSGSSSSSSSGGNSGSPTTPGGSSTNSASSTSSSSGSTTSTTPKSDATIVSTGLFGLISVVVAAFLA